MQLQLDFFSFQIPNYQFWCSETELHKGEKGNSKIPFDGCPNPSKTLDSKSFDTKWCDFWLQDRQGLIQLCCCYLGRRKQTRNKREKTKNENWQGKYGKWETQSLQTRKESIPILSFNLSLWIWILNFWFLIQRFRWMDILGKWIY